MANGAHDSSVGPPVTWLPSVVRPSRPREATRKPIWLNTKLRPGTYPLRPGRSDSVLQSGAPAAPPQRITREEASFRRPLSWVIHLVTSHSNPPAANPRTHSHPFPCISLEAPGISSFLANRNVLGRSASCRNLNHAWSHQIEWRVVSRRVSRRCFRLGTHTPILPSVGRRYTRPINVSSGIANHMSQQNLSHGHCQPTSTTGSIGPTECLLGGIAGNRGNTLSYWA